MTAPLSARMKAAVGLVERSNCSTCCRRGCWSPAAAAAAAGPVKTTVLTTPETQRNTHNMTQTHNLLFLPELKNIKTNRPTLTALLQELWKGQPEVRHNKTVKNRKYFRGG